MSGPRYDVERFGCQMVTDAAQADVLMISGCISIKAAPYLREVYDQMRSPKWVIAIGSCANSGGFFADGFNDQVVKGATEVVPVDVFISGCPPRPEAIMNGILALQEKIYGS
jgi:NADH-quinone oxidoreductase B subunit